MATAPGASCGYSFATTAWAPAANPEGMRGGAGASGFWACAGQTSRTATSPCASTSPTVVARLDVSIRIEVANDSSRRSGSGTASSPHRTLSCAVLQPYPGKSVHSRGIPSRVELAQPFGIVSSMSTLLQDIRYAVRMLLRTRGFTTVAVLTLALGIGANTALFSIVYAVLLKPLPYEQADDLVMLWSKPGRGRGGATSPADFLDYRKMNTTFEDLAAMNTMRAALTGRGEPVIVRGAQVSAGFFRIMRVQPERGRAFTMDEDRAGGPAVVVLSHAAWQERFAGDPRIVGRAVTVNGKPFTVTGIMPAGFDFPRLITNERTEFWVPIAFDAARAERGGHFLSVIGRLRPGATLAAAQAQMDTIATRLQQQYPDTNTNWVVNLFSLRDEVVSDARSALVMLTGAVAFVLLIACANVANLLLARATSRARELAVRSALGAASGRLLRQLLTESIVLSFAGALVGVLIAAWGLEFAKSISGDWLPRSWEIAINGPVLVFTMGAALLTGILFGLAP